MSLFPRGFEVLCWRVYVRWSVSLFHFIAFACHLSIFCCRDRISHSSMLCCHLSLCYPIWLLSLPVISFFEGDDAKMLFFSLSLRPLWVCFYFTSRKFIFVMRFISEHVNTVSQSRGSPSCVWVLSGGCQACVLSVSILLSPAGWMHLKRLKLRSTRSRSQKSWTSFNLFFWDAAVKNQKVEICFSND